MSYNFGMWGRDANLCGGKQFCTLAFPQCISSGIQHALLLPHIHLKWLPKNTWNSRKGAWNTNGEAKRLLTSVFPSSFIWLKYTQCVLCNGWRMIQKAVVQSEHQIYICHTPMLYLCEYALVLYYTLFVSSGRKLNARSHSDHWETIRSTDPWVINAKIL